MDSLLERFRSFWDALNDRERRMMSGLAIVLALLLLGMPLGLIAMQNGDLRAENDDLRALLDEIEEQRPVLALQEQSRKSAETRYKNVTPPLGTYLETEAKKHSLTLFEVTEQPEKTEGAFTRRGVRAGINDVDLTSIMNLMHGIVTGGHPVAIDHVQIEHYQSGDQYKLKLGVLTFDRKGGKSSSSSAKEKVSE